MNNSEKPLLISCEKICKTYRKGDQLIKPLEDLDLQIYEGEFLALMGPSGSGKTTLLNLLSGIDSPTSGRLVFSGEDITLYSRRQLTSFRAQNIGYIFQLYHLVPVLTAYENVELPLLIQRFSRKERHARVMKAMELVGIADRAEHYPRQLSGGQEQRVAIARALVTDPPLLVADEPTGDLDAESAGKILDLLRFLSSNLGKTIVMVTHDMKAAKSADRILSLEKGVLMETDNVVS
jgi:putative ABC transport system ATP-binding protein